MSVVSYEAFFVQLIIYCDFLSHKITFFTILISPFAVMMFQLNKAISDKVMLILPKLIVRKALVLLNNNNQR